MKKIAPHAIKILSTLVAGALLPLAFAPFGYYVLAIICPTVLLGIWLTCNTKQAFAYGFLFGLGFFGVGASWIFISIHDYGNTDVLLAGIITGLFVLVLALFPACQGYLLARFFPHNNTSKICLAFPASWVLFEWIRSWFLTGFPWLILGISQTNSPLRGFAPVVGEFGLSFIITLSSSLLILSWRLSLDKRGWHRSLAMLLVIWLIADFLTPVQWTHAEGKPVTVSLVQGDIPQELKWSPGYLQKTLQIYLKLTQPHWTDSQIIVWPEAAIPLLLNNAQDFITLLAQQAQTHHVTFITGIPIEDGFTYYNAMLLLNHGEQRYYKRHLVPFGEYVPLAKYLRGLIGFFSIPMSDFSGGPTKQSPLKAGNIIIAPFICYEVAYEQASLNELPQANLLLTITNDAWFNHSIAMAQHIQLGQFRALETGRYHLFTTNTGITAIINPRGQIQATAPAFQATVLTGEIRGMWGITPIIGIGVLPFIILFAGLFFIALLRQKKST